MLSYRGLVKLVGLLCFVTSVSAAPNTNIMSWPNNQPLDFATKGVEVVNVWATWCVPCRREMPVLSKWYHRHQQDKIPVSMVGIALDSSENISQFVKKTPVSYPLARYTGNDSRGWMAKMGNSVGALPFTVVRVPQCHSQETILGEVSAEKLNKAVQLVRQQCKQQL